MDITKEITEAISDCRGSLGLPRAFAYLSEILETLEAMRVAWEQNDGAKCRKLASGLGRLITEDISFMESPLGGKLSDIVKAMYS